MNMNYLMKSEKKICLIFCITMTLFLCSCKKGIPEYIATSATVEAGDSFSATDFLLEEGHAAEFATDFAKQYVKDGIATINQIGEYDVDIVVDGKNYAIKLNVQDTIAPKATARKITICIGDAIVAEDCITDIQDKTKVTCVFKNQPDLTQKGMVGEIVVLTDEAGNTTEIPVSVTVLGLEDLLQDKYTIEAGGQIPTVEELIVYNRTGKIITDTSAINTSLIGTYTLEVEIEGEVYTTELVIQDTVAPKATINTLTAYFGTAFPAADGFVSDIVDEGPVKVSYESDPGATVGNQSAVRIVLTDQGGNTTVYDGQLEILSDNEAPQFVTFPEKLEAIEGNSLIWKNAVSAKDNSGIVDVSLDASKVNTNSPGTYTAYFVAKDPAGNATRQEVQVIIKAFVVTDEMMNQVCEKIVNKIITDNMTTQQKLRAVYKYVSTSITYTNTGSHDDTRKQAYLALTTRKTGDCFSFYAASRELLNYLGFETQMVRRRIDLSKDYSNHFWVLVNCGTKENPAWYHHDSCPQNRKYKQEMYMMTDAQLRAYTRYREIVSKTKYYYTYDTSLHPASATEIVVPMTIDSKYYEE